MTRLPLLLFVLALAAPAQAVEILRWERLPLAVPLVVDHERVVFLDRPVRIGVPTSLGDRLRVQSAGGAVYLRAKAPIEPTRLQLQDADTGALILLDLSAQPGEGPLEPIRIITQASRGTREDGADETTTGEQPAPATATPPDRATPIPVVLTRYAAQSLYAPLRTVEPANGVMRASLRRDFALDTLLPTLPVRAKALVAWRLEDQWVTAIRLRNTAARWIDLDPRALQGDFVAATFQHPDLGPAGESHDTTVVYLVTRGHGLVQSLLPAISPVDAALNSPASSSVGHAQGTDDAQ